MSPMAQFKYPWDYPNTVPNSHNMLDKEGSIMTIVDWVKI